MTLAKTAEIQGAKKVDKITVLFRIRLLIML